MPLVRSIDGTSIAFEKMGQGPNMILIDGALCYRENGPMRRLANALSPHFTVYIFDRRGRGESGNTLPYSVDRELEDVAAILKEAGGKASLMGISSGAVLAARSAAKGLNLENLILFEPPMILGAASTDSKSDREDAHLKGLIQSGKRGAAIQFFLTQMVGLPKIVGWMMPFFPGWSKMKAIAHTLPYDLEITKEGSLPEADLNRVHTRALVIHADRSQAFLKQTSGQFAKALGKAEARELPGTHHSVPAPVMAQAITQFLNANH